ncbi:MAG TPA: extracellular solute-binding protein [Trebonia sp.]|jgi:multiple sugar transport system substrate-binding protein|nr:extracellular solute-binding protein [Trebonia sp.]
MRFRRARLSRFGVVAAVTALAGMGLSACSGGSGSSNGDVTISYMTNWAPAQVKQLEAVAAKFHEQNPKVTVQVEAVPFANLLSTVETQGASPDGPAIAGVYDLWLPQLITTGIAAKAPANIASMVHQDWPANLADDVSQSGSTYGIPSEVDLYALNYNKELFKQAGISSPPTTWSELISDAAKLTNKAKGQQGFGVISNWAAGVDHPFLSLAASNGGSLLTSNKTSAALTSPNVEAVADLYQKLISAGSTVTTMSTANADTTGPYLDNFANGKTAMIIMANWWESALQQTMGSNFQNVGTAPIPVGPSGTKSSSISYAWLNMVNAHVSSAEQQAAWEFLQYLNSPSSGQNGSSAMGDILLGQGILPSRTSDLAAHRAELSSPFIKTYVDEIPEATPFPTTLGGEAASDALQTSIENLIFGRATPSSSMATASQAVDSALQAAG